VSRACWTRAIAIERSVLLASASSTSWRRTGSVNTSNHGLSAIEADASGVSRNPGVTGSSGRS
jgi:hypothetical protein